MKKIVLLLFCIPLLMASTCEKDNPDQIACTTEARAGLNVTVVDNQTNLTLSEGVIVTAKDGNYEETLQLFPGSENVFTGAWERPGNYIIKVTKEGYTTYNSSVVTITSDICHVISKQLNVSLQPL